MVEELTLECDHIKDEYRGLVENQASRQKGFEIKTNAKLDGFMVKLGSVNGEVEAIREEFADGQDRIRGWREEVEGVVGSFFLRFLEVFKVVLDFLDF